MGYYVPSSTGFLAGFLNHQQYISSVQFTGGYLDSVDCCQIQSDQNIATSHDLTPNGGLVAEIFYFREIKGGEILYFGQIQSFRG